MERGGVRDGRIWVLALVSCEPGPNHLPPRLWEIPSGAGPATLGMGPGRVGIIAPKQALSSVVLGPSRGQARGRWLKRSQGSRVAEGLCPTRPRRLPCEAEEAREWGPSTQGSGPAPPASVSPFGRRELEQP